MDRDELSFTYFPDNYRWSHGLLLALGGAPWGGGEIGEINRVGLRLRARVGDDRAWFEEWTRMAEKVEAAGRERAAAGKDASAAGGRVWRRGERSRLLSFHSIAADRVRRHRPRRHHRQPWLSL